MRNKPAKPRIPAERQQTVRHEIISVLEEDLLSAKAISGVVRASEKDVYDHLVHIQKKKDITLRIIPAECKKCGFVFRKRERLRKPGRCPDCRGESIKEPLFSIKK